MSKTIRPELQPPVSPARRALADALAELRAAERAVETARAPVPRLEAELAAEAAALGALERLDADYARRMAVWAEQGRGDPPAPAVEARRQAQAALDAARLKGQAARNALAALESGLAEADRRLGEATGRVKPAVAAALREEGDWLVAEYWRRHADLELVRRELAALDQVLLTDFPLTHAPTGRAIVEWVSPDRQSASAQARAVDAACNGLDGVQYFIGTWRRKAEMLTR
jgi:hypothetical protein